MDRELLFNPQFAALDTRHRHAVLQQVAWATGAELVEYQRFERFGKHTDSAMFRRNGKQFVFVPGAYGVHLGWEGVDREPFSEEMLEDMAANFIDPTLSVETEEDFEKAIRQKRAEPEFVDTIIADVQTQTTKLDQFDIAPMLVQQTVETACWKQVSCEEAVTQPRLLQLLEDLITSKISSITRYQTARITVVDKSCLDLGGGAIDLQKAAQGCRFEIYEPQTFAQLQHQLHAEGCDLPSWREWEYLCSGGRTTLFPWGNSFDYNLTIPYFETGDCAKETGYDLARPNFFGLVIAYDPYAGEIVTRSSAFGRKGSDGGGRICGGLGIALGFLPTSPFYQDWDPDIAGTEKINGTYYFYRRVIRL